MLFSLDLSRISRAFRVDPDGKLFHLKVWVGILPQARNHECFPSAILLIELVPLEFLACRNVCAATFPDSNTRRVAAVPRLCERINVGCQPEGIPALLCACQC